MRPAPRPCPFVGRSKLTTSLGGQDKTDVTHIHGKVNQDGVPIYDTALTVSESAGVQHKLYNGDNQVLVLVDSGALGNYFDKRFIIQIKHHLLDRVDLTVPRKILTARGSLMNGITEVFNKDFSRRHWTSLKTP